jgi:hypothetical protein
MARTARRVVGPLLGFKSLSRAPVNELGVVYLFGVLHEAFGFEIGSIQSGFPDCLARLKIGEGRWEEVRIELGFESKSLPKHGHHPSGADMIVCWKHNWPGCPGSIQVIELGKPIHDMDALIGKIQGKKEPVTAWRSFAQKHRLEGKSFQEISELWKRQQGLRGDA